jgi:hypothetical protein
MVCEVLDRRCAADRWALHRVSATALLALRLWPEGEGLLRHAYGPGPQYGDGGGDQYGYGPRYRYARQAPN